MNPFTNVNCLQSYVKYYPPVHNCDGPQDVVVANCVLDALDKNDAFYGKHAYFRRLTSRAVGTPSVTKMIC